MPARPLTLAVALLLLGGPAALPAAELEIGFINFYGLHRLAPSELRPALAFTEGDVLSVDGDGPPARVLETERQLGELAGVERVRIDVSCCDAGRATVYIGVVEKGAPTLEFRTAPDGDARLPDDLMSARAKFADALMGAVLAGRAREDRSQGHSLVEDPATRAVQERFPLFAERDRSLLVRVLRESSDASHRAFAAQLLGYVAHKPSVVDDLVYAMSDADQNVRNDAMRALLVFAATEPGPGRAVPHVPWEPFVALLGSEFHTDRNKACMALLELSEGRDPELLAALRRRAKAPLAEMARFRSETDATVPLLLLARIIGESDEAALAALRNGQREAIVEAALGSR